VRLYLIGSKPTDSVIFGFLPAAARLGLDVVLLTDQPGAHERARAAALLAPGCVPVPGCVPDRADCPDLSLRIIECDVWDPSALIGAIGTLPSPDAIFSNSDRLQTQTALAAAYFGVPGKDWRSAMRAKNKSLMRLRLAEMDIERIAACLIRAGAEAPVHDLTYPVVLKPAEGVASEDVVLVENPVDLAKECARIFDRRPGEDLLAEDYLAGPLHTLETISDGVTTWVLGGFRTQLSPPPFFIEERLTFAEPVPADGKAHVLRALTALGVTFGACHTEYVLDPERGPALIEVNDRLIGDHCDFVLSDLLGTDLFELALRIHLGERLPLAPPTPLDDRGHAIVDYVVADKEGVLAKVPSAGPQPGTLPGVQLSWWPLREVGDRITLTHANRDYLGVISAIGADPAAVNRSVAAVRTSDGLRIVGDADS
jgi:biotin carboxylase